ncbi:MAG: S4 domain-containing protein YaaA [Bacilli bacterium]|jgi:ribosome-associated protein|nr:S4 domain-containing protein YaaA [Bacilli bacterium]
MTRKGSSIYIKGEYITLGQLLKFLDLVQTGGEEKLFVVTHDITFNGEPEERRGKKLRDGDEVTIDGELYKICTSNE